MWGFLFNPDVVTIARKSRVVLSFLKNYINFAQEENVSKFEGHLKQITNKNQTMGIVEYVMQAKIMEARDEAIRETRKEDKELFVKNLFQETSFSPDKIARLAKVSEAFVNRVKKQLAVN